MNSNYLDNAGATSITARAGQSKAWKCGGQRRPCKRMECDGCAERRRLYFVESATILASRKMLDLHCTVTLPCSEYDDPWLKLSTLSTILSKRLTGKIGPFIRTLAIGEEKRAPHVHYLIRSDRSERLYAIMKTYAPKDTRIYVDTEVAFNIEALLDYFFKKNFLISINTPDRIKGIRLLSGSRGITYGYPKARHWKALEIQRNSIAKVGLQ